MVAIMLALFFALWMPVWQWRADSKRQFDKYSQQLAWIEANRSVLSANKSGVTANAFSGNWSSLIGKSVPAAGLTLKTMNPDGNDGVSVQLENQPFDKSIAWLSALYYQNGAVVEGIEITPGSDSGRVNLRVTLRRAV